MSTFSYLNSIVRLVDINSVFDSVHPFIPPTTHPFHESITKANVPVTISGRPDLLLHNLPIKVLDFNNIMDINDEEEDQEMRLSTNELLQKMAKVEKMSWAQKVITLIGVSGCGKTRTMFEVLSGKVGLYFIANNVGNGGSSDMQVMRQA